MNPSTSSIMRPRSPRPGSPDDDDDGLSAPPRAPRQRHHTGDGDADAAALRPLGQQRNRTGSWGGVNESDEDLASTVAVALGNSREPEAVRFAGETRLTVPQLVTESRGNEDDASATEIDEEEQLRQKLAFFFMDPVQKYVARRQIPWKLVLQMVKILLVTAQIFIFGDYRYAHTKYYTDNQIAFEHLFLKGWDAVREIHAYPPATGAYALYQKSTFYDYFNYMAGTFHQLDDITVNPVFRNSSFDFCIEKFAEGKVFPNLSWNIDFENMETDLSCISVEEKDLATMDSKEYLKRRDFEVPWDTMTWMHINFSIKTLTYTTLGPLLGPECFTFHTTIKFDNSDYDGQIPVNLDIEPHRKKCPSPRGISSQTSIAVRLLNYTVIGFCALSFVLCMRALVRAQLLRSQTERVFKQRLQWDLTRSEKLEFLNVWYIVICVNDVFIIIGSVIKELIESRNVFGDLWDFCSLFLGIGNLLVWIGMLRYLGFFKTYNVLILTMKGALPNVLRFLLCASFIYFGFVFCGWLILGPYNFKFKTIFTTSECLFSLINGDDMFATFSSVPTDSRMIWVFSKVYLYFFISLFIYVILSLFIAIIMDTYDIIKEYYKKGFPKERMHEFYRTAGYNPASGIFRRPTQQPEFVSRMYRTLSYLSPMHRSPGNGHVTTDQTSLIT